MIVVASPFLLSGTSDILFKWYFLVIGNHLAITTYPDRPYPIPWPCRWHQWKIVGWHWPNRSIELPTNPDDNIKTFLWASPASFSFDVGSFQSNLTITTTMWKISIIRPQDSNLQPLDYEFAPLTTRPRLPLKLAQAFSLFRPFVDPYIGYVIRVKNDQTVIAFKKENVSALLCKPKLIQPGALVSKDGKYSIENLGKTIFSHFLLQTHRPF